jgi:predicted enzyme related to lactoylglutathione lyase
MVDDIEITMKKIIERGGTIVRPLGLDAPEITAWFQDLSGNILGLYQEPGQA